MKLLIVLGAFYRDIADMLKDGAIEAIQQSGTEYDIVEVPGALEIPPVIAFAGESCDYDGYIALGCVIRGETTHYDYVCQESARGLMDLGIHYHIPIGNGILTVESKEQALVRADKSRKNKGRDAVEACLSLIRFQQKIMVGQ